MNMKINMAKYLKEKYNKEMKEMTSAFAVAGIDGITQLNGQNFARDMTKECLRRYKSVERNHHRNTNKLMRGTSYDKLTGPSDNLYATK